MEELAQEMFGWSQEEFGDCRAYLKGVRNMLQNEIDMCNEGTIDLDNYGYKNAKDLREDNTIIINKINTALLP
jgi:hypothetical protein